MIVVIGVAAWFVLLAWMCFSPVKRQTWREGSALRDENRRRRAELGDPPVVVEDRTHARRTAYRSDPLLGRRNVARSAVPTGPQLSRSPVPEYERTRAEQFKRGTTWTRN